MSPPTPKAETKDVAATQADIDPATALSRDAQHSSYAEVPPEDPDAYPPDGPHVEQTLGEPTES